MDETARSTDQADQIISQGHIFTCEEYRLLKHPEFEDERVIVEERKERWTEEEGRLMVRIELELIAEGVRFINKELARKFPY